MVEAPEVRQEAPPPVEQDTEEAEQVRAPSAGTNEPLLG